jgi:hypothetical protein
MHIGAPIVLDDNLPNASDDVSSLTQRVDAALHDVTLNFPTTDDANRVLTVSTLLAEVFGGFRPLHSPDPPLAEQVRLAQRINIVAAQRLQFDPPMGSRIDQFMARLNAFDETTRRCRIAANDVQMNTAVSGGVWFVVRELLIAAFAGPLALWGRLNHWLPLRLARLLAVRISHTPDEPATNTMVAGLVLVLGFYTAQTMLVGWGFGLLVAILYAASLPLSATWDFRYADRRRRAMARVRTYLRFRREPAFQRELLGEFTWLRAEALALNSTVDQAASREFST